jgi:hypothetical protein
MGESMKQKKDKDNKMTRQWTDENRKGKKRMRKKQEEYYG